MLSKLSQTQRFFSAESIAYLQKFASTQFSKGVTPVILANKSEAKDYLGVKDDKAEQIKDLKLKGNIDWLYCTKSHQRYLLVFHEDKKADKEEKDEEKI